MNQEIRRCVLRYLRRPVPTGNIFAWLASKTRVVCTLKEVEAELTRMRDEGANCLH